MIKFMDMRINLLWEDHIVEDDFVKFEWSFILYKRGLICSFSAVANCGYKIIENDILMKSKTLKEMVFHLIGHITKKWVYFSMKNI